MKRAALHSLGCKVNSYETEAMRQILEEAGYEIVPFHECADLYVINTCSVTNVADKKSRQMIHRAKKQNPDAIVVAAGCYVQTSGEQIMRDAAVDIVIGNNKKKDLLKLVRQYEESHKSSIRMGENGRQEKEHTISVPEAGCEDDPGVGKSELSKYHAGIVSVLPINEKNQPYEELKVSHPQEHTRAFLKVQDGCNQFCSYCIIPYARGRVRSRSLVDVVEETKGLAANGFQEIVLTGIHLSSYGVDTGSSLLELIKAVHAVDGIRRIRLGSLEPGIITRAFVEELAGLPKVCPHFHLSLQSGSDTVLRRMNRKYTAEEYFEKCEILREYYGHPALTTDIIVGFPGETGEEFAETCAFAKRVNFYEIHVFQYSKRDGTVAARMPEQIPGKVKSVRSHELMQIAAGQKQVFIDWYDGKEVEVLFEEPVEKNGRVFYEGFTPEYVKVCFPSEKSLQNRIIKVEFSRELV